MYKLQSRWAVMLLGSVFFLEYCTILTFDVITFGVAGKLLAAPSTVRNELTKPHLPKRRRYQDPRRPMSDSCVPTLVPIRLYSRHGLRDNCYLSGGQQGHFSIWINMVQAREMSCRDVRSPS